MNGSWSIWAGLGNPGGEYEATYHNIGRRALEFFAGKDAEFRKAPGGLFEYAKEGGRIYVRTLSYMNESGPAIRSALKYFEREPGDLVVFHDDSDLPLGSFRISSGSGAAGHHGIESLIKSLKTRDFARVRIGIRPEEEAGLPAEARSKRAKAGEFVLKKISAGDRKKLQLVFSEMEKVMPSKDTP